MDARQLKTAMSEYLKHEQLTSVALGVAVTALKAYGKQRGNMAALADSMGVSRSYLSDIVRENRVLGIGLAQKITKALAGGK